MVITCIKSITESDIFVPLYEWYVMHLMCLYRILKEIDLGYRDS